MENTSSEDIALKDCEETLIGVLSKLLPPDIFKSKELETCFREFLGRGTAEDCLQLFPQSHKAALSNPKNQSTLSSFRIVPQRSQLDPADAIPFSKDPSSYSTSGDSSTLSVSGLSVVSSNTPVSESPSCYSSSNSIPPTTASTCADARTFVNQPQPTADVSLSGLSNSVVKYFEAKSIAPVRIQRLARLIRSFVGAKPLHLESYRNLWCDKGKIFDGSELGLRRIGRLHRGRLKIEKDRTEYECAARLCLMFSVNDVAQYSLTATATELGLRKSRRRMTAALERIAQVNKILKEDLIKDQKKNRNYFHMLAKNGPGSLLEIEPDAVSDWEVKASEEDIDLVLEYRETHLPKFHERAEALNGVGARTIVDGLLEYGWTSAEVISSPTPFLKLVRKYLDTNLEIPKTQDEICATQPLDDTGQSSEVESGGNIRVGDTNRTSECDRSCGHLKLNKRYFGSGEQTAETCPPPADHGAKGHRPRSYCSTFAGSSPSSEVISNGFGHSTTTEPSAVHIASSDAMNELPHFHASNSCRGTATSMDQDWMRFLDSSGELPNLGLSSSGETDDQDWMRFLDSSGELPNLGAINPNILINDSCTISLLPMSDARQQTAYQFRG